MTRTLAKHSSTRFQGSN